MFGLFKKKNVEEKKEAVIEKEITVEANNEESEIAAAIAFALNRYLEDTHDYEKMVMTIQKVMRPYSPWSSKIYSMTQNPRYPR